MGLRLEQIVPWGRSFEEYVRMFDLSEVDLRRRILGCADGPAAFNAGMLARGQKVISVDPLYAFSVAEIRQRIEATYATILDQLQAHARDYVWDEYRTPEQLGTARMAAMETFLTDFPAGRRQGRYLAAALPRLPFADGAFELALCSHCLFTYSEQLPAAFHVAALEEMARVAREVRVFPILDAAGHDSPHLPQVAAELKRHGFCVAVRKVPYRFQVRGDRMLVVRRGGKQD